MELKIRKIYEEPWEPWIGEGYENASSLMMVNRTDTTSVSCRIIKLKTEGHTEMHTHDRVHHVIILDGVAEIETFNENVVLNHLVAIEVPPDVPHRFINNNDKEALILVLNIYKN